MKEEKKKKRAIEKREKTKTMKKSKRKILFKCLCSLLRWGSQFNIGLIVTARNLILSSHLSPRVSLSTTNTPCPSYSQRLEGGGPRDPPKVF